MPELPEVEVVKRGLEPHLVGRKIHALRFSGKKLRIDVPYLAMKKHLIGTRVIALKRRAKYLIAELSSGGALLIHLGMTGRLGIFSPMDAEAAHDHLVWLLDNDMELRFNDVRRFGSVMLLSPNQNRNREETIFSSTGPEPFAPEFNGAYLQQRAAGKSQPVKSFLMTNSVAAGIGNIYANESLFAAGIRPTKPAGKISRRKWDCLVREIQTVLSNAISCGGSTISDFIGASGEQGYFQVNFRVYGKKGDTCSVCSTALKAVKIGGRASFFCPRCQR